MVMLSNVLETQGMECFIPGIKTALVHERLNVLAGSDKVLITMHEMFPNAPIYTALADLNLIATHLPDAEGNSSYSRRDRIKSLSDQFKSCCTPAW